MIVVIVRYISAFLSIPSLQCQPDSLCSSALASLEPGEDIRTVVQLQMFGTTLLPVSFMVFADFGCFRSDRPSAESNLELTFTGLSEAWLLWFMLAVPSER